MATTINLAPGTQHIIALRARRQRLFMASAIIAAAILLVWGGLYIYQQQLLARQKDVASRVQAVNSEIANLDTDAQRIILFEERLADLGKLLDGHVSWNPLLSDIERLLPSTTTLTGLTVSLEGRKIAITGLTPDIDQVAVTLASLGTSPSHKTAFTSASISTISRRETRGDGGVITGAQYEFSAELTFAEDILYVNK
ncbi:MAG: PilN domain-containing protein [Candidatus Andersenbacteria bacterium]|nr:PilN domain-containing protein [Candidatus Andersenbacteria bacterium]